MQISPAAAREALQDLCSLSKVLNKDVDLGCVKKLLKFIEQQENAQPQTAALLKPPIKEK